MTKRTKGRKVAPSAATAMGDSILVAFLGGSCLVKIMDFLLENRISDYTKKEIAEGAGVSWGTFFKYWPPLERAGVVLEARKVGRIRLYQLNGKSPVVRAFRLLESHLVATALKEAENAPAKQVMLARQAQKIRLH